ncbi:MAG: hypothetical protein ABIW76_21140, partial [Fibrobacteria bacterium]
MPTVKVILTPKNHSITNQDKAKAVWLIKKYTSHAWIKRTKEAIETFIPKYEEYISKRGALEWRK